ncbi:AAA family ATPase [Thauera sp. SWB20]|uniref:AAA family ATPase n=1 Tax=Thauera sp. SWB20 TaxID=1572758 RepID=UPI0005ADDF55|nr:AAA family ATPase [Thauera sp. SWB20]KIN88836.1 AAA domain family protein [Thauera sp. SWB20]
MASARAPLRERLAGLLAVLEAGLVERRQVLRASLLAALAGEHSLLIGPPGTAKSALARRIHLAFRDARYFERLLTRFTVPEELFGPLSIRALEEDRYERHVAGFLPDAAVAFIDEVFKANSAILNALLTLLNEREFDNGAGRLRCPLISVVGATNQVPEDEVAEAFFDRFLLRLTVAPVSAEGFRWLLGEDRPGAPEVLAPPSGLQLDEADRAALAQAAAACALPAAVLDRLGELRAWLAGRGVYVSDRRWVKLAHLLRVAAASEGRAAASEWDLGLAPCCVAADEPTRLAVADWLAARLGIREVWSPPRITRVVEAFEAQLATEREARDLDYDERGRLRFSAIDPVATQAGELAGSIGDAKGGAAALRMSAARMRRYGSLHIGARTAQLDGVLARLAAYRGELGAQRATLEAWADQALWADPAFVACARSGLDAVDAVLAGLEARARSARAGFEALPRLEQAGAAPAPVEHDPLPE